MRCKDLTASAVCVETCISVEDGKRIRKMSPLNLNLHEHSFHRTFSPSLRSVYCVDMIIKREEKKLCERIRDTKREVHQLREEKEKQL